MRVSGKRSSDAASSSSLSGPVAPIRTSSARRRAGAAAGGKGNSSHQYPTAGVASALPPSLLGPAASPLRRSSSDDVATDTNPLTATAALAAGRHSLDTPSVPRVSIQRPSVQGWPRGGGGGGATEPSSEAETEATSMSDTTGGDFSPAMTTSLPLPEIVDPFGRRRSASTSATDALRTQARVGSDSQDDSTQETLEHSDGSFAPVASSAATPSSSTKWYHAARAAPTSASDSSPGPSKWYHSSDAAAAAAVPRVVASSSALKHLRSDSSLSSLASHPADDTSTPYPAQTTFTALPRGHDDEDDGDGGDEDEDDDDDDVAYAGQGPRRGSRIPRATTSPTPSADEGTPRFTRHSFDPPPAAVDAPSPPDAAAAADSSPRTKPSTEALLAARSRLRRPSRSHLKRRTLAQRNAERQQQQNAWFHSHARDSAHVARVHAQPKVSALSAMLQKQGDQPENPFAHFYAGIAGRNANPTAGVMNIDMTYPWAKDTSDVKSVRSPSGAVAADSPAKTLKLAVRKDATMEELIGYGLYCFVEEGWAPALEDGGPPETRLSTLGWVLRIVEDGEIDDDYPAIDRSLIVGKFGQDEFAIVDASPQQVKQNEAAMGTVKRRASRLTASTAGPPVTAIPTGTAAPAGPSAALAPPPPAAAGAAAAAAGATGGRLGAAPDAPVTPAAPAGSLISVAGTPIIASSALGKTNTAVSSGIFLRVAVTPNAQVRYKTTLNVPSETYLADVLDLICKKRRLANPDEWAFVVPDQSIVVPLDRTVESLQGSHDLALVKRSTLGAQGGQAVLASQSTNPNASIFKRLSEPAQPRYNAAKDITSSYKSWTVNRKMPMFVGRHERTLTIDGDWIHIIPTDTRAFYAHAASFPILDVVSCKQSTKLPQNFKLIFSRDNDKKRFDLEAEDSKQAADIAFEITTRKRAMRR